MIRIKSATDIRNAMALLAKKTAKNAVKNIAVVKSQLTASYVRGENIATIRPGAVTPGIKKQVTGAFLFGSPRAGQSLVEFQTGNINTVGGFLSDVPDDVGAYALLPVEYPSATVTTTLASNNQVRVFRVTIRYPLIVSRVIFSLTAGSSGTFSSIALYSSNGLSRIFTTGAGTNSGEAGLYSVDITDVHVPAGPYWLAWCADNTTTAWRAIDAMETNAHGILNTSTLQMGTIAGGAAGACPNTMGTVTTATFPVPIVKLQS